MELSALKDAFQGLSAIGNKEKTIEIGGVSLTLRTLLPPEELEIQTMSRENLGSEGDDNEPDQASVMAFIDEFRKRTLAYSIVAIGDLNLRKEAFIFTGDLLEDGTKVKIPKEEAVLNLLGSFSRAMLAAIFDQYTQLTEQADKETEQALGLEPTDDKAEIERLTERLEELKNTQQENYADASVASSVKLASMGRKPVEPPKSDPPAVMPASEPQSDVYSSIIGDDPMEAIQRETERLQKERGVRGMPAPHTQAKKTSDEVFKRDGDIGGVEVFRMPAQNLAVAGTPVAKEQIKPSTNPNFKPSK